MEKWTGGARHERGLTPKVGLMLLAGILLILAVNIVTQKLVDNNQFKMGANQILSPWDKSAAPPPLAKPSPVATRRVK